VFDLILGGKGALDFEGSSERARGASASAISVIVSIIDACNQRRRRADSINPITIDAGNAR